MESFGSNVDKEPTPRDVSKEFLTMDMVDFYAFLRTLRYEPALSIVVDWQGVDKARALKAFLEQKPDKQIRTAAIRATKEQKMQELNVFGSGVKWIEVQG